MQCPKLHTDLKGFELPLALLVAEIEPRKVSVGLAAITVRLGNLVEI